MKSMIYAYLLLLSSSICLAQGWSVAIPNRAIYSIATNSGDSSVLYAGNVGRIFFISTDAGANWEERAVQDAGGVSEISLFKVHPVRTGYLYAGGIGLNGLDRSTDGGETWTRVLNSSDGSRIEFNGSNAVAFHPNYPDTMYALRYNNGTIYRSGNAGETWDSISTIPGLSETERIRSISVCPDSTNVLIAGGRLAYVRRSTDGGLTWSNSSMYPSFQPDMDIANFAWSPTTPGTAYMTAGYSLRQNINNGGLHRSTDYGLSWERIRFMDTSLYALFINGTPTGDQIYVGGNQVDFPTDSGYIDGDSIVVRLNVSDSTVDDLSNVPWTENEIGIVGTNVWGFAVTYSMNMPMLLMASTGGLFITGLTTDVEKAESNRSNHSITTRSDDNNIYVSFQSPPDNSEYRVVDLDGRVLKQGLWSGETNLLVIPFSQTPRSLFVVQVFSATEIFSDLLLRY